MHTINHLSIFPFLSSIICIIVLVYIAVKGEKSAKLHSLFFLLSCVFLWSFGQFLEYSTKDIYLILQYTKILHSGVAYLGIACFLFCLQFVDSPLIRRYSGFFPVLLAIPTIVALSVCTNELHWLFLKIEPPGSLEKTYARNLRLFYWVETVYNYVLISLSVLVVVKSIIKSRDDEIRKQRIILLPVLAVPTLAALLFDIFSAMNKGVATSFDIAPTSFSISLLLMVAATFRYHFLDIIPITLKEIFYNMKDSVVILDRHNRILKSNASFMRNFGSQDKFSHADDLVRHLMKCRLNPQQGSDLHQVLCGKENTPFNCEFQCRDAKSGETRIFDIGSRLVRNTAGFEVGRIITFCDITAYKELAAENERNRIALEIHDSIGYGLTNLILLIKDCKISMQQTPDTVSGKLDTTLNIAEILLRDLRYTVSDLKSDKEYDLVGAIDGLADHIRSMGIAMDIKVIGEEQYQRFKSSRNSLLVSDALYRAGREAVTNSLRHGSATAINIIMKFQSGSVHLHIIDNGRGCRKIKKGIGLLGMEERIKRIGGRIAYGSHDERGFNVSIQVPTV